MKHKSSVIITPFKAIDQEKINEIQRLADAGEDHASIAEKVGVSIPTVAKYVKAQGKAKATNIPDVQNPVPSLPSSYQAPDQSPGKLEERSALSGNADLLRDQIRMGQGLAELQMTKGMLSLWGDKSEPKNDGQMFAAMSQLFQFVLSQQGEKSTKGSEEISILRFELEKLREQHEAEYRARIESELKELNKRLSQEANISGEKVQLTKLYFDALERYGIGSGDLRADALLVGSQLGGLGGRWKEPGHEYEPLQIPKKSKGVLVPISEAQMSAMTDNLERGEQSSKAEVMPTKEPPSVNDAELQRLRGELTQSLRDAAELRSKLEAIEKVKSEGPRSVIVGQQGG